MDRLDAARLTPPESAAPTFTGMALDRAQTLRKDASWINRRLKAPDSRAVAASSEGVLLEADGARVARRPLPPKLREDDEAILLGLEDDSAVFAVDLERLSSGEASELVGEDTRVVSLREAGTELPRSEGGLAAYAAALLNWHRTHRFCPNCGGNTEVIEAGYARRCVRCGRSHFPRTDPVVIMLVESQGRLLLGRRAGWPAGRYSVLAGFVSPGESAEEAVMREVHEESGIGARDPAFVASQPWPFPSSLMLGFEARADDGEPFNHDGELDDVAWFTRERVRSAASGDDPELELPPSLSIARFLIDRWLAGEEGG
jgi:NAD+ diphosphatase